MKTVKNLILTVLGSALLIVLLGLLFSSANGDAEIPRQFFAARLRAGDASKNMARMIDSSLQNLQKIEELQAQGQNRQALDLVGFEVNNAKERQDAAILLSAQLEQMAKATAEMSPDRAERLAVEAVSTGVAMVSRMINYNSLLTSLFTGIQNQLATGTSGGVNISSVIADMNVEAEAINTLSSRFNELLDEFDNRYVE